MDIQKMINGFKSALLFMDAITPQNAEAIESLLNNQIRADIEEYAQQQINLSLGGVSNWLAFDEVKPEADKLILVTNGIFVEIAYYEDGEIMKPFSYDKDDTATFNSKQNGLKWQYAPLLTCC